MKYILVNFGGPRSLEEVEPFLIELLTDRDLIQTRWPNWLHRAFFRRVARKRAHFVKEDYAIIGGKSPIFEDTEALGSALQEILQAEVLPFHRYLPSTHASFVERISAWKDTDSIRVIPLFPQFSYTTTGSIARWFTTHLSSTLVQQMQWIRSYPEHPAFTCAYQDQIQHCLGSSDVPIEKTLLLFSAHGLPVRYVREGDPYSQECERSFAQISAAFPLAGKQLCYQSLFGKEEWLRPYTAEFCKTELGSFRRVIVVPLSFTSDHIETLFEIEQQYLPLLRQQGLEAVRCPALNRDEKWIQGLAKIASKASVATEDLIRD